MAVRHHFGEAGEQWLSKFPGTLDALARRWNLQVEAPFPEGWPTNIVYRVTRQGEPLVLKTGYPQPELLTEIDVLVRWRGEPGRVQLLDLDADVPCALLERIEPGMSLRETRADYTDAGIPQLINGMPVPCETGFPAYREWTSKAFARFRESPADWLAPHVDRVERIVARIHREHPCGYLLHGDLHHQNLLLGPDGRYVAIDPKGVIGPRLLEYGRFMHNFVAEEAEPPGQVLRERAAGLAAAGDFSAEEVLEAGYADCVLALTWTVNDGLPLASPWFELPGEFLALLEGSGL